jgi:hypothetical protein
MVLTGWQPTENWLKYNSQITQGSLKEFPARGGAALRAGRAIGLSPLRRPALSS